MNATLPLAAALSATLVLGSGPAGDPSRAAEIREITPNRSWQVGTRSVGRFSERTLVLALEIDSEGAALVAFTAKERPFDRVLGSPGPDPVRDAGPVQIEVVARDAAGRAYTQRLSLQGVCLDHPAGTAPHVEGDTVRVHRDTVLVEVPEIAGFDRVEAASYRATGASPARVSLGTMGLSPSLFAAAAGRLEYRDLAIGRGGAAVVPSPADAGSVHWPEEFGDSEVYTVFGNAAEVASRVNIVIVPDGYTYADKPAMQAHAQAIVNAFRGRTPFKEHDPFLNYILIYAYSTQSGTDQCDCGIVQDTAMNTRFPQDGSPAYPCGDVNNRCLYYGTDNGGPNCDPNTSAANIAAAELRSPAVDRTIVMVNTSRYGGCGGSRAVYSAGHSAATEIAIHEMGHALGGLADEYAYTPGCGSFAGEINTSRNGASGAWPEWVPDIGLPREGAQYYQQCLFRPFDDCEMRTLGPPFCAVCNQRWSLVTFGHARVAPTAPIRGTTPASPAATQVGLPTPFSALTRLSVGSAVTNNFVWRLQGPGFPSSTTVATGSPDYAGTFAQTGQYTLSCEVTADTNFVKPQRTGANRDTATWTVNVTAVPEVSSSGQPPLAARQNGSLVDLQFADTGSLNYNLYVSTRPGTAPFNVASAADGKHACGLTGLAVAGDGVLQLSGYSLESGITGPRNALFFLVTADNGPGTEGPLGAASDGTPRTADQYCAR